MDRLDEIDEEALADELRLAAEPQPDVTADRRVLKALGVIVTVDTTKEEATISGTLAGVLPTKLGYALCTKSVGGPWISLWAAG